MITTQPIYLFGAGHKDLPPLPDGFSYDQHPKNFVTATDGVLEYLVQKGEGYSWKLVRRRYATPADVRRSNGKIKPGSTWIDSTDTIQL